MTTPKWTHKNKIVDEIPEGSIGFVYLITNITNGRKYIGKKLAQFKKTRPPLKGKKNKRRSTVETDWKDYWGSSDRLNKDIDQLGKEKFTREIIYLCKTRGETNYMEVYFQIIEHVLLREDNYNGIVNVRLGNGSVKNILVEDLK